MRGAYRRTSNEPSLPRGFVIADAADDKPAGGVVTKIGRRTPPNPPFARGDENSAAQGLASGDTKTAPLTTLKLPHPKGGDENSAAQGLASGDAKIAPLTTLDLPHP